MKIFEDDNCALFRLNKPYQFDAILDRLMPCVDEVARHSDGVQTFSVERAVEVIEKNISNDSFAFYLLLNKDRMDILGYAFAYVTLDKADDNIGAFIHQLYFKKGLFIKYGRKCLPFILEWARQRKCTKLMWTANYNPKIAYRLLNKFGKVTYRSFIELEVY